MKIGIEAQRIFRPDKHGMDFVILEVLRRLRERNDGHEYVVFVAPGEDPCLEENERMQIIEVSCPTYPLWEQWALPRAVRQSGVDMLHCTSNTAPLHCSVPLLLTLHDVIYLQQRRKPQGMSRYQQLGWHYRRWNVPHIVGHCRHIITVSATEQSNIVHCFPHIKDRISVIHNGVSPCYRQMPTTEIRAVTRKYLPDEIYLLCLGNTDPRKNTEGVLTAYYHYLKHSPRKLKLILTGLTQTYVENQVATLGISECLPYLICPGYIPGADLPALYNGAFCFLFPSLLEGFGIPVLEAMACGTPVITSNCSSLPEVAGKGGLLINPLLPSEITELLIQLEKDSTLYQRQKVYGLRHAALFSWDHTAENYLQIYNQMGETNPYHSL